MVKTPRRKRLTPAKKKKSSKPTASAKAKASPSKSVQAPPAQSASVSQTGTIAHATLSKNPQAQCPDTPTPASAPAPALTGKYMQILDEDTAFWNPPRHESSDDDDDEEDDDDDEDSTTQYTTSPGSSLLHTPTSSERIRITRKNAVYDRVVGAMRGSRLLDIPRSKPLRNPIDDIARNTRRFNRIIKDIIMRCERLSEETGCWLLLLAQVPTSKALTHYSSSRLRREVKSDTLRIINQYQTMIRTLLAAKRDEAISIQKRYEEVQRDLQIAEQAKLAMQAQLDARESELARKEAELAQYRVSAT
ncbi:hypothetical protein H0H92_011539 [Tricholoma furcatifolium]|nr:hypothetical protein H0H92_011539 [Tricholoma furcatifolium]